MVNFTLHPNWNVSIAGLPGTPPEGIMSSGEAVSAPLSPCIPVAVGSKWHSSKNSTKGQTWWPGHCCAAQVAAMELRSLPFQELDLFKALPKRGWFHLLVAWIRGKAQTVPC